MVKWEGFRQREETPEEKRFVAYKCVNCGNTESLPELKSDEPKKPYLCDVCDYELIKYGIY